MGPIRGRGGFSLTRLHERVAIVTGAGRGIGKGIAARLATEGAAVVVASRTKSTVEEVVADLSGRGHETLGITLDVADRSAVDDMVGATIERYGRVDILVNNAQSWGTPDRSNPSPQNFLESLDEAAWDYAYQTGLKGTLYSMCAVLPSMKDRGQGRIINTYSPAAQLATAGLAGYNCAKAAIFTLTRTAAREWAPYGITVNCIAPAIVNDAIRSRLASIGDPDERRKAELTAASGIPMGHLGDAELDAGAVVAFLASDDARFVTGVNLRVDGGLAL